MFLYKCKWMTLAVAICFAILQALQPFIHAHLDVEHPIQHTGFHIGGEHEESVDFSYHIADQAVSNVAHDSHTVSVASGMKEDFNSGLFADTLSAAVLCLCFAILLVSTLKFCPPFNLLPYNSLRRRLPSARAPPQF